MVTATELKPMVLFKIILDHNIRNALVFTKSTESTGRLLKLWECFESKRNAAMNDSPGSSVPIVAKAYSSDLSPAHRKSTLNDFRSGSISMYVDSPSRQSRIC